MVFAVVKFLHTSLRNNAGVIGLRSLSVPGCLQKHCFHTFIMESSCFSFFVGCRSGPLEDLGFILSDRSSAAFLADKIQGDQKFGLAAACVRNPRQGPINSHLPFTQDTARHVMVLSCMLVLQDPTHKSRGYVYN